MMGIKQGIIDSAISTAESVFKEDSNVKAIAMVIASDVFDQIRRSVIDTTIRVKDDLYKRNNAPVDEYVRFGANEVLTALSKLLN